MPIEFKNYIETDPEYHQGIALNEFKGKFSIVACELGSDGKAYMQWCHMARKKNGKNTISDKVLPVKVNLGDDRFEAIDVLHKLLSFLGVGADTVPSPEDATKDDDIPF